MPILFKRPLPSLVLVVAVFLLIGGCATSQTTPSDWVLNPPSDSITEYWGVGEGYDLDTARRTALRAVASKLRVSVSGSMQSQTSVRNDTVDRTAQSRVSEVVQETEFTNVTVEKSSKFQDGFYVLVKVDRRAFVKETQTKFDDLTRLVDQSLADFEKKSPLDQFQNLQHSLPNIEKAIAYGQLLRVADHAFTDGFKITRLEKSRQQAAMAATKLVISLEYAPQDADIARAITDFLNSNGIRVSPTEKDLVLKIESSYKQELLFGNKSHQLQVALQLWNGQMQNVASKQYKVNGNSLDNFESARQDAVRRLGQSMKSAGASAGLGLKV